MRGSCTNPKENFRLRQQDELSGMVECADCGYGFTPMQDGGKTLCDDCIDNRKYWREVDAERQPLESALADDDFSSAPSKGTISK